MTTLITRFFADRVTADEAMGALRAAEFDGRDIDVITADSGDGPLAKRLAQARVFPAAAQTYEERLQRGGALLVVRAPVGTSGEAKAIADRFNPTDVGVQRADGHLRAREKPMMGMSRNRASSVVLLTDSRFFDWIPDRVSGQLFGSIPAIIGRGPRKTKLITRPRKTKLISGTLLTGSRKTALLKGPLVTGQLKT